MIVHGREVEEGMLAVKLERQVDGVNELEHHPLALKQEQEHLELRRSYWSWSKRKSILDGSTL
jgi:hypothetical protein